MGNATFIELRNKHKKLVNSKLNESSLKELRAIENDLSLLKEANIKSIPHNTMRLLQVDPTICKFPIVKTSPKKIRKKHSKGSTYNEVLEDKISFRHVTGKIRYNAGELSDTDRLVYFSIENRFVKYIDFIMAFGFIPISLSQIATDIGFSNKTMISQSIYRLRNTELEYVLKNSRLKRMKFLGEEDIIATKTLKAAILKDLKIIKNPDVIEQAQEILDNINWKAPTINLFSPSSQKIKMIQSKMTTSIDLWFIKGLKKTWEKTLYLFLWDRQQVSLKWANSTNFDINDYQVSYNITELSILLDLKPKKKKRKEKIYYDYSDIARKVETSIKNITKGGKFLVWHQKTGRGISKNFLFQFPTSPQRQIPRIEDSKEDFFKKIKA